MCPKRHPMRDAKLRVSHICDRTIHPDRPFDKAFDPGSDTIDLVRLQIILIDDLAKRVQRSMQHATMRIRLERKLLPEMQNWKLSNYFMLVGEVGLEPTKP